MYSAQAQWSTISDFPGGATDGCASFEIDGMIYMTGGLGSNNFYQLDPETGSWTQKTDIPGGYGRSWAIGFSIDGYGYVGGGDTTGGVLVKDFHKYNPETDSWTQVADFGGGVRDGAFACSLNGKGYVFGGFDGTYPMFDAWSYDPTTNKWKQLEHYQGGRAIFPTGFVIGDKIYVGTGSQTGVESEQAFWEYDPATDKWTEKANFPGAARQAAVGFTTDGMGYIGGGETSFTQVFTDFYAYNPTSNTWTKAWKLDMPKTAALAWSTAVAVNNTVVIAAGADFNGGQLNFSKKCYKASVTAATLGIESSSDKVTFNLYPNPATNEIVLDIPKHKHELDCQIQIMNLAGVVVMEQDLESDRVDVSQLSKGMYTIRLVGLNGSTEYTPVKLAVQ